MKRLFFLLLILILTVSAANVSASSIVINVTEDTVVSQANPNTNFGTGVELVTGMGGTGGKFQFYLNFSNVTALSQLYGKIITSANINLTFSRFGSDGSTGTIYIYRMFNTTWRENTTTWNGQASDNNTNHSSDLFQANSTYNTYALLDVSQAIGYAAARNQTNLSFIVVSKDYTINKLTYFASKENNTYPPTLEVTYEEPENYEININTTNILPHSFGMGLSYYYTNGTGDSANITSALKDIGGNNLIVQLTWDIVEPDNSTPADLTTQNWSGFNFNNGREDEFYNNEWHNSSFYDALQAAKNSNPSNPPTILIHAPRPPEWLKVPGIAGGKWYPFNVKVYPNTYYFWKMVLLYATQNASYPANKIIIKPLNEPYGNSDPDIMTYVNRLDGFGEMLRASNDAIQDVDSRIRILGIDDNDPTFGLTEDLFARNATVAKYLTAGISAHNYLHGDTGYLAWDVNGRPALPCPTCSWNPYGREWELLYTNYMTDSCWNLLRGNASLAYKACWLTENQDKFLAYNDGTGNNDTKMMNTTNDALWWAARWSSLSTQGWNVSIPWILQNVYNINGYNADNTTDTGWGFIDSFQNNWTKYEAYNVSKTYDTYTNGKNIINTSNNTLNDNYIFVSAYKNYNNIDIFITNYRNSSQNLTLNITNITNFKFPIKQRRTVYLLNDTKVEDVQYSQVSSIMYNYILPPNSSVIIEFMQLPQNFSITPSNLSVSIDTYNSTGDYRKVYTSSSNNTGLDTAYNISDFPPNKVIQLKKNGVQWMRLTSNSTGHISFNSTPGQFEMKLKKKSKVI